MHDLLTTTVEAGIGLASGMTAAIFLCANFIVLKKSRTPFKEGDKTINRRLAYILWGLFMTVALFQALNAAGLFEDTFAAYLLPWSFCCCSVRSFLCESLSCAPERVKQQ